MKFKMKYDSNIYYKLRGNHKYNKKNFEIQYRQIFSVGCI